MAKEKRFNDYIVYKPTKKNTGAALSLNMSPEMEAVFVRGAAQKGEHSFDWEKRIVMKWGLSDIGKMLALLEGRTKEVDLFHKTDKGHTTFTVKMGDDPKLPRYFVQMSKQDAATKQVARVGLPISDDEACILTTLLKTAVVRITGW
ncbi:MAG: hypothetical protein FJ279_26685 [Planctomycetes bacterium]|nr:hypothetical protein [Planctomycetota bacterium]